MAKVGDIIDIRSAVKDEIKKAVYEDQEFLNDFKNQLLKQSKTIVPIIEVFKDVDRKRVLFLKRKSFGKIKLLELFDDYNVGQEYIFDNIDEIIIPENINNFIISYNTLVDNCFKL